MVKTIKQIDIRHRIKKQVAMYAEPEQYHALKELSEKTRVPMQVYLREGVDAVLKKHAKEIDNVRTAPAA